MEVTSIEALQEYGQGTVVKFPDFGEGQPFIARIRRPSMLALAKTGKIPNSLLLTANGLFTGKGLDDKKAGAMADLLTIIEAICEDCFVKPSYKELKEAGVQLTDDQMMFIFNYTQQGVKALEPFREEPKAYVPAGNEQKVSKASV